ncbi:MAG: zinc ribbon domain-containing protein [Synergistaceae bacterium]|jgi:hypothetical protein|nr:zinc ribbon domain-containing protein [Synergistaceae bacterium]
MFCTQCGHKLNDTAFFCPQCGVRVGSNRRSSEASSPPVRVILSQPQEVRPPAPTHSKKRSLPKLVPLFSFIGFLAGLPASYFFQDPFIREKLSLVDYIKLLPDIISDKSTGTNFTTPIIASCLIGAILFGVVGYFIALSKKSS